MTREEAISRLKEGEPFSEIYDPVWDEALNMAISALENKGDLISRQAVKDIILSGVSTDTDADKEYVCDLIDNIPSVENKGKWIEHEPFEKGNCNACIECSVCRVWLEHDCYAKTNYCPNCGAKMKGGE